MSSSWSVSVRRISQIRCRGARLGQDPYGTEGAHVQGKLEAFPGAPRPDKADQRFRLRSTDVPTRVGLPKSFRSIENSAGRTSRSQKVVHRQATTLLHFAQAERRESFLPLPQHKLSSNTRTSRRCRGRSKQRDFDPDDAIDRSVFFLLRHSTRPLRVRNRIPQLVERPMYPYVLSNLLIRRQRNRSVRPTGVRIHIPFRKRLFDLAQCASIDDRVVRPCAGTIGHQRTWTYARIPCRTVGDSRARGSRNRCIGRSSFGPPQQRSRRKDLLDV